MVVAGGILASTLISEVRTGVSGQVVGDGTLVATYKLTEGGIPQTFLDLDIGDVTKGEYITKTYYMKLNDDTVATVFHMNSFMLADAQNLGIFQLYIQDITDPENPVSTVNLQENVWYLVNVTFHVSSDAQIGAEVSGDIVLNFSG